MLGQIVHTRISENPLEKLTSQSCSVELLVKAASHTQTYFPLPKKHGEHCGENEVRLQSGLWSVDAKPEEVQLHNLC